MTVKELLAQTYYNDNTMIYVGRAWCDYEPYSSEYDNCLVEDFELNGMEEFFIELM